MNERIRELLKQATEVHDEWSTGKSHHVVNHKMFAELIVRECCQKLEDDGMVEVAMEMKEHFGVEK